MFCPECGAKVKEGISFCSECGEKLSLDVRTVEEKGKELPPPSPKPANKIFLFLFGGLLLVGLTIGGFFWWKNNQEFKEGGEGISSLKETKTSGSLSEPVITASASQLVLVQTDVGTDLKLVSSSADPKMDDPGIKQGLVEGHIVGFENQEGNTALFNLAFKYTSLETAKTGYEYFKNNSLKLLTGEDVGEESSKIRLETLTSEKFGNESMIQRVSVPSESEETFTVGIFRKGNIVEVIYVAEKSLTESSIYQYARILERRIDNPLPSSVSLEVNESSSIERAKDAKIKSDLSNIRAALELYKIDKGVYPNSLDVLVGPYLKSMLTDPRTDKPYQYQSDGKTFTLSGKLSDGTDYKVSQ